MKILTLISAVCTLKPMHFFILFPTPHIPLFTYYLRGCIDLNQQSGTTSCENVCLQALPKITPARPHVPSKNNWFRYKLTLGASTQPTIYELVHLTKQSHIIHVFHDSAILRNGQGKTINSWTRMPDTRVI